ncbi:hypothetical protein M422DRAFT_262602 [Sphaerobolus stellatus SS14]|uniref:Uncharacterized protein n=1 Tax=Sphaerobolus stellatus (strain SS14) TaxID=990650 RepID=A0A0C9UK20_SPHS4|nr:hypothetical protein M422DRAFT_262602 [Sphaerobolus stellatus SS14]
MISYYPAVLFLSLPLFQLVPLTADDFHRLVSSSNPVTASQYRPAYPPTSATTPPQTSQGLDPFFFDDDLEMTAPNPNGGYNTHKQDLLGADLVPDSAIASNYKAMYSTESGLPLSKNAAPPPGHGIPQG